MKMQRQRNVRGIFILIIFTGENKAGGDIGTLDNFYITSEIRYNEEANKTALQERTSGQRTRFMATNIYIKLRSISNVPR